MVPFWHNFYTALNESLQVEKAMAEGRGAGPPVAMALYLRQSQRLTFKRLKPGQKAPAVDPSQVYTDLQQSREMVSQLKTLEKSGDMPESVKRFLDKESARQVKLKADLDPWTKGEDDKS